MTRADTSGHVLTVAVASGATLDGALNGTATVAASSMVEFEEARPGSWRSAGGLTGTGGAPVTTVAQVVSDAAFTGFAPRFPDRGFTALRSALDMGQSTAIGDQSDSTGDSNGAASDGNGERLFYRFAQKIAARYPNIHVMSKVWSDTTQDFSAWNVLQAQAAGRRYAATTTRSLRYLPLSGQVTPTFLDMRMLVALDNWSGAGKNQTFVFRGRKTDGSFDYVVHWRQNASGVMEMGFSQDGVAAITSFLQSTAPVPGAAGQPLWVRATLEVASTPTAKYEMKFFTSPPTDGTTWTQLGTTKTQNGTYTLNPTTAPFWEIGAKNWQPSADSVSGKIFEVQIRSGNNGPSITPCCPEQWQPYPDASTTYGGAQTLYLINGARSGQNLAYLSDPTRMPLMTPDYGQTIHLFNTSHNEGGASGPVDWTAPYQAWVEAVNVRLPTAVPVVVGQNPHTSVWANEAAYGYEHQRRLKQLAALAGARGWGHADVFSAFANDPRGIAALITSDGLHPNSLGYEVGALTLMRKLGYSS